MPKKDRLTGSEIRRLKPQKRLVSSLFSVSITFKSEGSSKIACVVSKKVSMKAVVRNRLKRQMRAALSSASPLPTGADFVLTAKKQAGGVSYAELRDDIAVLIERVRSVK